MDPILCCALGLCCPPFSAEQHDAYEKLLTQHFNGDAAKAKQVCDETFDAWAKVTKKLAAAVKKAEKA